MLGRLLFRVARHPWSGAFVGLAFARLSCMLPVRRVWESQAALAFHHPRPSWPLHVLIVPKRRVPTLVEADAALLSGLLEAGAQTAGRLGLAPGEYVLCANGGARQDVKQLHFHLFTGEEYAPSWTGRIPDRVLYQNYRVTAFDHPDPAWERHVVLRPAADAAASPDIGPAVAASLAFLVRDLDLARRGFTLVILPDQAALIAGPRRQAINQTQRS